MMHVSIGDAKMPLLGCLNTGERRQFASSMAPLRH